MSSSFDAWARRVGKSVAAVLLLKCHRGVAAAAMVAGLFGLAGPQPALAQLVQQGPKLVGSGAAGTSSFQGTSVALSGDGTTALVGGSLDSSSGATWVFTRSGGVWTQQGAKLVGTGAIGVSYQGQSVALSSDGNTALVGGYGDNSQAGAAWVFTRSGGIWSQQGPKLVGTGTVGTSSFQGYSVALSADGNTAIIGAIGDNSSGGAAWVFTRSGSVWSQQQKLVGIGATGAANQGSSVALSADGNTALVGGYQDNSGAGATWVFTRSGGVWTQQGSKLVGTGAAGNAQQGLSVALSGDGNTALVGGYQDNSGAGATWVFTRSGGVWSQQGSKLVGAGAVGAALQGVSVALSANGNSALVGGFRDNSGAGAGWVFTRSGGVWSQYGGKLAGSGALGNAQQGVSVALSAAGNVALMGGNIDGGGLGAAWPFARHIAHDFNDDATGDILWRDAGGDLSMWLLSGGQVAQAGGLGTIPTSYAIVGQRDFTGSGNADILWRDPDGNLSLWVMNGLEAAPQLGSLGAVTPNWSIYGTGDLNADGVGDILWRNTLGDVAISLINDAQISSTAMLGNVPTSWSLVGDDSRGDIFWHDASGNYAVWQVNGAQVLQTASLGNVPLASWSIVGLGDFNGDGYTDILWRDTAGDTVIWFLDASFAVQSTASLGNIPTNWSVAQTGDYNGDAKSDILWIDTAGDLALWSMNGGTVQSSTGLGNVGTAWTVQSLNAE